MAEFTLVDVFGSQATQDVEKVILYKSDLAAILTAAGYTFVPAANNSVDSLMLAIVCAGLIKMTPASREADPVNKNVEFSYDPAINYDSPTLDGQSYSRHTVSVASYVPIPTPKLNPSAL
jgi:hypothetical protein